jgi:ankyrin repeat protein
LRELLEDNEWLGSNSNVRKIAKILKKSKGDERYNYFGLILDSTRYDLMKVLVKRKILSEEELFNIALRCKLDELRMCKEAGDLQHVIYKKALIRLSKERRAEFYSALIDALLEDKSNGLVEPQKKKLIKLYRHLLAFGFREALAKLHDYMGYFNVHRDKGLFSNPRDARRNSEELIAAIESDKMNKMFTAMKLMSKGHYVYNFRMDKITYEVTNFIFLKTLNHPNYNPFAITFGIDRYEVTPLVLAARQGCVDVVETLLEMANGNVGLLAKLLRVDSDKRIIRPLEVAIEKGHEKVVAAILKAVNGNEWLLYRLFSYSETMRYALRGFIGSRKLFQICNKKIVPMLLEAAGRNEKLLSALFHQRYYNNMFYCSDVSYTFETKHLKMFKLLIKKIGWSTECLRKILALDEVDGFTNLNAAMTNRHVGVVKFLLKAVEGKRDLLEELLLKPDYRGKTIFHNIIGSLSYFSPVVPPYPYPLYILKEMFLMCMNAACKAGIVDKVFAAKNKGMRNILDICKLPILREILQIYQIPHLSSTAISQAIAEAEKSYVDSSKVSRKLIRDSDERRSSSVDGGFEYPKKSRGIEHG